MIGRIGLALIGAGMAAAVAVTPAAAQPGPSSGLPPELQAIYGMLDAVQNTFAMSLSSTVNRPVAPFTTGLATDTPPGYCGPGIWKRVNGGSASQDTVDGELDATFFDLMVGADISCFDVNGMDYSFGLLGGNLWGEGTLEGFPGTVELNRATVGGYATLTTGPFSGFLLLYGDQSDYSAADGLPAVTKDFLTADRVGLSGSASYKIDIADLTSLFPTVGFDTSTASFSGIDFDPLQLPSTTMEIDDYNATTIYAGLTLQKVFVLDDKSAVVPFVSGTLYEQLEAEITGSGELFGSPYAFSIEQEAQTFAEIGAGVGYVKVLDGELASAKQLTLAGRVDYKWNDESSALNLTAQARLQF
jgi:outer membrane autotransporter protein